MGLEDCRTVPQIEWLLAAFVESNGRRTAALRRLGISWLEYDRWWRRMPSEVQEAVRVALEYGKDSAKDDCAAVLHEVATNGDEDTAERVKAATAFLKSESGPSVSTSIHLSGKLPERSGADLAKELLGEMVVETTVREIEESL